MHSDIHDTSTHPQITDTHCPSVNVIAIVVDNPYARVSSTPSNAHIATYKRHSYHPAAHVSSASHARTSSNVPIIAKDLRFVS